MRVPHWGDWDGVSAPPPAAIQNAESLLDRLGATGAMVSKLARYPLPPRLARVVVEALERGVGETGCAVAALLGSGAPTNKDKTDLLAALESSRDPRVDA